MTVLKALDNFQMNVCITRFKKALGCVGKPSGWDSLRPSLKSLTGQLWASRFKVWCPTVFTCEMRPWESYRPPSVFVSIKLASNAWHVINKLNSSGVTTNNDNGFLMNTMFSQSSSTGRAHFPSRAVFHPKPISFCHGIVFFKKNPWSLPQL